MRKRQIITTSCWPDGVEVKWLEDVLPIDEVKKIEADAELWESGKLGRSVKHARVVSEEQDKALMNALGLTLLSFKIEKSLARKLKGLAKLDGIGYEPLARQILTHYVRRNERRLDAKQASVQKMKKPDKQLSRSLKYKETTGELTPMCKEHGESNRTRPRKSR